MIILYLSDIFVETYSVPAESTITPQLPVSEFKTPYPLMKKYF